MTATERSAWEATTRIPTWLVLIFYGSLATLQFGAGVAHAAQTQHVTTESHVQVLSIIAVGSSVVTAMLGGLHAWLNHQGKLKRLDLEIAEAANDRIDKMRLAAIDKRLHLLERGIPCENADCPVIQVLQGDRPWDTLPPLKKPCLHPNPATAKPGDDTVDVP